MHGQNDGNGGENAECDWNGTVNAMYKVQMLGTRENGGERWALDGSYKIREWRNIYRYPCAAAGLGSAARTERNRHGRRLQGAVAKQQ